MAGTGIWIAGALAGAGLVACTTFGVEPAPATTQDDAMPIVGVSADAAPPEPPVDAGAPPDAPTAALVHWQATVAKTKAAPYGGSGGACNYTATFSDVAIDVVTDEGGAPTDATVAASLTLTNTDLLLCLAPTTTGTAKQGYVFASAERAPDGTERITLAPLAGNATQASLVIQGDFTGAAPELSLEWTHPDPSAKPLPWTIDATATASRVE